MDTCMHASSREERIFLLPGGDSAGLAALTGHEEEWLSENRNAPNALAASALLSACVLSVNGASPPRGYAQSLLVGERDYLLLQLRRLTFGDRIQAVVQCPECHSPADIEFSAGEVQLEKGQLHGASYEMALADRRVEFRLPIGRDQEAVCELSLEAAEKWIFDACLIGDAGVALNESERQAIIAAMEAIAPRVDLDLDVRCPECASAFTAPFDMGAFFFEELRGKQGQLLREVHSLALGYHWSQAEILSLTRSRRRAYLSMLNQAFSSS